MGFQRPPWLPDHLLEDRVERCIHNVRAGRLSKAARILSGSDVSFFGPTAAAGVAYLREVDSEMAGLIATGVLAVRDLMAVEGIECSLESALEESLAGADVLSECRPFRMGELMAAWHFQILRSPHGPSARERQSALVVRGYVVARADSPWHLAMEIFDT